MKKRGRIMIKQYCQDYCQEEKVDIFEVFISKSLINSYNSHDEFVSVNNMLRKYNKMKQEIKNAEIFMECIV